MNVDVMEGKTLRVDCLPPHGFVELVDAMPRMVPAERPTCDFAVVQAARTSTGLGLKSPEEDRNLIRYCMRHRHTSVFEQVEFKWVMSMPIFVARQFIRHRTANVNELSGRYSVLPDMFYIPSADGVRAQSGSNKQGSDGAVGGDVAARFVKWLEDTCHEQYEDYAEFAESGVSRELARMGLPLNVYTRWTWKCDLHNTTHFLNLRASKHAQEEIRVYAEAMLRILAPLVPVCLEAWTDYVRDAVVLTRQEVESLRSVLRNTTVPDIKGVSSREVTEWVAKWETISPSR
jgi:thymidylate synthase (FAD)